MKHEHLVSSSKLIKPRIATAKDFKKLTFQALALHQSKLDPNPRVNSCPRSFCCCVKLDSSYQVSKIAEIFWVNQQGAIEKLLDPGRLTGILATEVLLQEQNT